MNSFLKEWCNCFVKQLVRNETIPNPIVKLLATVPTIVGLQLLIYSRFRS